MQLNMYVWHDGFLSLTWQNCFEVLVSAGATLSLTHLRRLNSSKPWPARLSLVIKHFKMACYEKSFQGIHNWLRKDFDWKRNSFSGAFPPLFNCNHIRNTFQTSFSSETQSAIELLGNTLRQYISLGNNLIFCWATSFVVAILFGKNLFLSLLRFIWQQVWTNVSLQSHSYFELAHFSVGLSHTFYVASIVASLALNLYVQGSLVGYFWQPRFWLFLVRTVQLFWVLISVASLEHCNEVSAEFFCPVKMCFEFAREANFRWI